jgi:CMP-N,N'-diacetyllegionaminic acid synthase
VDTSPKIVAIIGARSGSKGMRGKNICPLFGKPLLAWPIEIAKKSKYINRIILSTDSEEYADIGREYGAETPFLRPAYLAADTSVVFEFMEHALEWLEEHEGYVPDLVVYICPTTPLLDPADIDEGIKILLDDHDAHSAILMSPAKGHPRKTVKIAPNGAHVISYITENSLHIAPSNRQSYEPAYNRESLPVVSRTSTIRDMKSQTGKNVRFHVIPQERALDIDTELDFAIVEHLLRQRENN